MKKKYTRLSLPAVCLLAIMLQATPKAGAQIYPYKKGELQGVCDARHKRITKPIYSSVQALGQFVVGFLPGGGVVDVYAMNGRLMAQHTRALAPFGDTAMITYTADKSANGPDSNKMSMLFASGRIVAYELYFAGRAVPKYDYLRSDYKMSPNNSLFKLGRQGKLGLYNVISGKEIIPIQYEDIIALPCEDGTDAYLAWNDSLNYRVVTEDRENLPVSKEIRSATSIHRRQFYFTANDHERYTFSGRPLPDSIVASSAADVWLRYGYADGRRRVALIDTSGQLLPYASAYHCDAIEDLGNGMFALIARLPPALSSGWAQADRNYVMAMYHSSRRKVVAEADFANSRIVTGNYTNGAPLWSIQTRERIVYLTHTGDTFAIWPKANLAMETIIPECTQEGLLAHPNSIYRKYYRNGALVASFTRLTPFEPQYRDRNELYLPRYYKAQAEGGKWGLYRISSGLRSAKKYTLNPLGIKIDTIVAALYDDITIQPFANEVSMFRLKQGNSMIWIDTNGRSLAGGQQAPMLGKYRLPDGGWMVFEYHDKLPVSAGAHPLPVVDRMILMDSTGKRTFTSDSALSAHEDINPEHFYVIDSKRILYAHNGINYIFNAAAHKQDALFPGYELKVGLVGDRAAACAGYSKTPGEAQNPYNLLEPAPQPNVSMIFNRSHKAADRPFASFGQPFGQHGIILMDKNRRIMGVLSDKGEVYE